MELVELLSSIVRTARLDEHWIQTSVWVRCLSPNNAFGLTPTTFQTSHNSLLPRGLLGIWGLHYFNCQSTKIFSYRLLASTDNTDNSTVPVPTY